MKNGELLSKTYTESCLAQMKADHLIQHVKQNEQKIHSDRYHDVSEIRVHLQSALAAVTSLEQIISKIPLKSQEH